MGKKSIERTIHFYYIPEFIAHWKEQTNEMKILCDSIGEPYGYSGMNVFYCFFFQYHAHRTGNVDRYPFLTSV